MNNNCPPGCPLCMADSAEEAAELAEEREKQAEDDANFSDQE